MDDCVDQTFQPCIVWEDRNSLEPSGLGQLLPVGEHLFHVSVGNRDLIWNRALDTDFVDEVHVGANSAIIVVVLENSHVCIGEITLWAFIEEEFRGDGHLASAVDEVAGIQHLLGAGRSDCLTVGLHVVFRQLLDLKVGRSRLEGLAAMVVGEFLLLGKREFA